MLWRGKVKKGENVKKGKKGKHEKELHSQASSVTLIQNVHNFTQLDSSGDINENITNN